jgi:U3 small nucleolar RNA-associated protein 5
MSSRSKKQRPVSTAAISLPQVQDSSTLTSLSHFSPDAHLFALLSLAIDKHRLRIFDATTGSVLVEHTVDAARVTSLSWIYLDLTSDGMRKDASPTKKRKKTATQVSSNAASTKTQLVCLGLSDGSLILFSPSHARVLRTISHPSSLAAVLATSGASQPSHVWSSSSDGAIRLWNAARNELLSSWKSETSVPYSALAPRPGQDGEVESELLVANHAMRLVSLPVSTSSTSEPAKLVGGISFTGHASAVTCLQWDFLQTSRFISIAEMDRVINVWRVPDPPSKQGAIVANIPLDAAARHAAFSPANLPTLLTISASGKLALFELPSPSKTSSTVATLSPSSTVFTSSKKDDEAVRIVAAAFVPEQHGHLRIAHLIGGVKPVFEIVVRIFILVTDSYV